MTELASLGLSIRSDGVVVATDRLKDFEGAGRRAEGVAGSLMRAAATMGAALAGAFSVRAIAQYADAWSDMQSRVGAAVKDMEAAPALMQRMVDLANASYSPLEQTVEVYTRNVGVLRDLGVSAAGAADFTESLNHMLVITATRGERAASVQNALSKAMATGKLQADGLETVLANGGRVAEALANELGTTVSGLRGMASQGKLTGDVIKNALLNSLEDVREEAAKMPATIGDAFTRIQTNTTALVGTLDQAWGISGRVAEQMLGMADGIRGAADTMLRLGNIVGAVLGPAFDVLGANMDTIASLAGVAVAALAGFYAPSLISGLWATSTALVTGVAGGIKAVTAAMLANPLGLLIAGLAAAVTAAFLFRDQIKQAIGIDVVAVMVDVGNKTIGVFVGAYEAVKEQWENLPNLFSALGKQAWNALLEGMSGDAITWTNPFTQEKHTLLGLDLTGAQAKLSDKENAALNQASATFNDAYLRSDYIKSIGDAVGDLWTSAEGAGDAIGGLAGQLGEGGAAGGQGLAGAAGAANDNIKTLGDTVQGVLSDMYNTGKSVFSGFFSDLKSGLQEGQTFWEALGNAGLNALDKIAQKALDMATSGIWDMIFGAVMGGLGGGSMGMFGISPSTPLGFGGTKGIYGIPGMAEGGTVGRSGLSWVGERGPELLRLPQGAQVIPNAPSMAMAANQNQTVFKNEVHYHNAPPVLREETQETEGGRRTDVYFDDMVAGAISRPRGASQRALGAAGRVKRR